MARVGSATCTSTKREKTRSKQVATERLPATLQRAVLDPNTCVGGVGPEPVAQAHPPDLERAVERDWLKERGAVPDVNEPARAAHVDEERLVGARERDLPGDGKDGVTRTDRAGQTVARTRRGRPRSAMVLEVHTVEDLTSLDPKRSRGR